MPCKRSPSWAIPPTEGRDCSGDRIRGQSPSSFPRTRERNRALTPNCCAFLALAGPQAPAGGAGVGLDAVALDLGGHLQIALDGARPGEPRDAVAVRVGLRAGHFP